ncbi:MAG: virulence factor TspB C-terminal domain-related protein [Acidithiobacillus ferriphilus]
MRDYLGLSDDRLSYGLLVGFLCLIFSFNAFAITIQWEPDPSNPGGQMLARRSSDGTLLNILDSTPGANFQWSFPANGSGGVIPTSPAPPLDVPAFPANGASGVIPIQGISEATAVDAADLAASAAPDILSIAGKALPLVGPALTLWQLYGVIENSSGSGYQSALASSSVTEPAASVSGCTGGGSSTICSNFSGWTDDWTTELDGSGSSYWAGDLCPNGGWDPVYTCSSQAEANQQLSIAQSIADKSVPSLQSWTAAQTAATIANDIANYLGSNPSKASNLANDLAAQPGGTPLSTPTPINYSGPSTATGNPQTVTTTNPDGSTNTQTVTPTVNITYGPDVSVTNDTTTKNYYCGSGASPSTASTGSVAAPVSSTNSTGTCAVTSATTSGLVIPDSAVAPTESFPVAPTVSVVATALSFAPTTSTGQCPPDVPFTLFGTSYNISWQPVCGFATDIEPFVTASGAILAGVLIFR